MRCILPAFWRRQRTDAHTVNRPSPASTFRCLLSSLTPYPAHPLPLASPKPSFAISFRARCIRMRWMHRTPRVMHDVHPFLPRGRRIYAAAGGVPRGSFAFSDVPPSASEASTHLFRSFHLLPFSFSHLYFSSYYISLSSSRRRLHPSGGFLPFFTLKVSTIESKPFRTVSHENLQLSTDMLQWWIKVLREIIFWD